MAHCGSAKMPAPEYAVFTEFSPDSKLLVGGWNTRVFTDADAQRGAAIRCDFTTGIVTLAPGIYHISGFSMVAYNSGRRASRDGDHSRPGRWRLLPSADA